MQSVLLVGAPEQLGAVGNHFHHLEPLKQWVVVVVYHHIEVIHHIDMAQQAQIMYHIQKNNPNQIYLMVAAEAHMHGVVSHRIVEKEEEVHWVAEMGVGGDWEEDNSEKEHKVVPLHGDLVKIVVEADFQVKSMAAVEEDEVLAESTGDEGFVDIVDAEVRQVEGVAAELKEVDIADLEFPEIEWVVGSMDLSEEQLGLGSEGIDLVVELQVAKPVGGQVEEGH